MRRGYVYGVGSVGLCDACRKWTLIAIVLETRLRLTHRGGGVRPDVIYRKIQLIRVQEATGKQWNSWAVYADKDKIP